MTGAWEEVGALPAEQEQEGHPAAHACATRGHGADHLWKGQGEGWGDHRCEPLPLYSSMDSQPHLIFLLAILIN